MDFGRNKDLETELKAAGTKFLAAIFMNTEASTEAILFFRYGIAEVLLRLGLLHTAH